MSQNSHGPINSGQINEVKYPGSSGGAGGIAQVEMLADIEVTCVLNGIRFNVTASASTTARAVPGVPVTVFRAQLGATTAAEVFTTANTRMRVTLRPESTPSTAATSAGLFLRHRIGALAAPAATSSVTANTGRLAAATVAFASGLARTDVKRAVVATAVARAVQSTPAAVFRRRMSGAATSAATTSTISPRQRMFVTASSPAAAVTEALVRARLRASASVVAAAVCESAAADYAATSAAPIERLMQVPPEDRRMEVVL